MRRSHAPVLAGIALALSSLSAAVSAAPGDVSLISVRVPGQVTSMYGSYGARISANGRFLGFFSTSPDLVARFARADQNLFVRNLQTGETEVIRLAGSADAFDWNDSFSISADGRYVAFTTASSAVPGDTNAVGDVFVRDRQTGATARVSVRSGGAQASRFSYAPSISADGRYVAFASRAANLVPGDSNKSDDVFVHDRQTGRTERVSVSTTGVQGNGTSYGPSISADGRYVAFTSNATNLVAGDSNTVADVFVHDRQVGRTERVSIGLAGVRADGGSDHAELSADGRYVVFASDATNLVTGDTNGVTDIFLRDRQAGTTERANLTSSGAQTAGYVGIPSISADGRYVAFAADATNLVAHDANGVNDIFVHDRLTGQTMLASLNTGGAQANWWSSGGSLSADGRYLGFDSYASNLVAGDRNGTLDVFVRDRQASTLAVASTSNVRSRAAGSIDYIAECDGEAVRGPVISADGRYVAFLSSAPDLVPGQPLLPTAPNIAPYAFVRDRQSGKTAQLGQQSFVTHIAMSADASSVAVWGECTGQDLQVIDRLSGASGSVPSNGYNSALSPDGRYVAFTYGAQGLVLMDWRSRTIESVSVSSGGQQANAGAFLPAMSAGERYVAFESDATNLVSGDLNNATDVFVRDRVAGKTERVSVNSRGREANGAAYPGGVSISADGRHVVFPSTATNLVPGDANSAADVFVKDRQSGRTERVSVASNGVAGNGNSYGPTAISPDGRYVTFASEATNLAPNYGGRFFVHDRQTGVTEGLLMDPRTQNAIAPYTDPSISADQRFVAFASNESLVRTDLNQLAVLPVYSHVEGLAQDIYVQERAVATAAATGP